MNQEDREILRIFYQELARSAQIDRQTDFYFRVLRGNRASRTAWVLENRDNLGIPPKLLVIVEQLGELTAEDIAVIAAESVAEVLNKARRSVWTIFWSWRFWPWNWWRGESHGETGT